jgi:hypothetical protein
MVRVMTHRAILAGKFEKSNVLVRKTNHLICAGKNVIGRAVAGKQTFLDSGIPPIPVL